MRFILVSADDPNLQRPLEVPDEITVNEPPKKRNKPIKREAIPNTSKRIKTVQKSRVYG